MKLRHKFVVLMFAGVVSLASCSSAVPGQPEGPGGSASESSTDGGGAAQTEAPGSDGVDSSDSGDSGDSESAPASGPDLTDLTSAVGDLSGILGPGCMEALNLSMTLGLTIAGPMMGTQLTEADIDKAFEGSASAPPELQGAVDALHKAALAAVGKPTAEAVQILGSDDVSAAMDQISKWVDANCDGGQGSGG